MDKIEGPNINTNSAKSNEKENQRKIQIFNTVHRKKLWNFTYLSQNPALTWTIVRNNIDLPWNWHHLSANPCVTLDIVKDTLDKPKFSWSFFALSKNPNITIDFIKEFGPQRFEWFYISRNPSITWADVLNNPDLPWKYNGLSMNPNITWDIVIQNKNKPWVFPYLSKNPNVTYDIVMQNLEKDWDLFYLSKNKNISIKQLFKIQSIFKDYFDKRFKRLICWPYVSQNEQTTKEVISSSSYYDLPWDWQELSKNKNMDIAYIMQSDQLPWVLDHVCLNPNLNFSYIEKFPHGLFSENPYQNKDQNDKNDKKKKSTWNWDYLSQNPSIFS